jgi:Ca2+:H+ antiporter
MIAGGEGKVDARSLRLQLGAVIAAVVVITLPSALSWGGGSHERHSLFLVSIPISAVLLAAYLVITWRNLKIHREADRPEPAEHAWSLQRSLVLLGIATAATAIVSEILVHSLDHFGKAVGLDEFFIAVVIVAIVGNAAEHGGAVVIAHRGNTTLATEIAITSSMQVAVFVMPAVCLLSWIVGRGLPLSFRVIEIVTMAVAGIVAALVVADGRSKRWEGFLLAGIYAVMVVAYLLA